VLDADTLLLEYSLGEERSYLWAVTPDSLRSCELPGRSEVEGAARAYLQLLVVNSRNLSALDNQAAGLSRMLLGPISTELKRKRLVIVGDGKLAVVPFAALPDPTSAAPLVADHELLVEPSASAVALLRRQTQDRRIPPRDVAVIADPVFGLDDERFHGSADPADGATPVTARGEAPHQLLRDALNATVDDLPRLAHTRTEALGIVALSKPDRSVALLDFKASKAAAQDPDLANYRVVHFATHGLLDLAHPGLSGLAFSLYNQNRQPIDGFLSLNEVFNLRLPVELVVLSACQSGLGKPVKPPRRS
jgi:CHAT domain-containing protein